MARRVEAVEDRLARLYDALRGKGWEPGKAAGWNETTTRKWYEKMLGSRTQWKNLPFACVSMELLFAERPDTVRGNMYMVVSAGWHPDTSDKSYDRTQGLLNRLRLNRIIPFEWVADNVRSTIAPSSWSGLQDFVDTVKDAYRKNFWAELPEFVEVIVEKDAIAGRVQEVTREYNVRLHPIRGYNSTSFAWEIASYWKKIKKPITVYYIGDHDPSGRDLERDIREKATNLSGKEVNWVRLSVNPQHFAEFNIIPLEPKKGDKRTPGFIDSWGRKCAEVEAIPASSLRQMVRDAIESHLPAGEWERLQEIEQLEKERWDQAMANLNGAA